MTKRSKVLLGAVLAVLGTSAVAWWFINHSMDDLMDDIFGDPTNWGT